MNISVPPVNTIEWPKIEYEYHLICQNQTTTIDGHNERLNLSAKEGWELIHIHIFEKGFTRYYFRRVKMLGVPI